MALDSKPKVLRVPETRLVKYGSAGVAIWWTILLLLPVHLFSSNLLFLGLSHMGNSYCWAAGSATVAILQLYGLYSQSLFIRWVGHVTATMFYAFITAGVYLGSPFWFRLPVNTGFGVYAIWAALNAYCAVFVLPNYVIADMMTWRQAKPVDTENPCPAEPNSTGVNSTESKSGKSIRNGSNP